MAATKEDTYLVVNEGHQEQGGATRGRRPCDPKARPRVGTGLGGGDRDGGLKKLGGPAPWELANEGVPER